MRFEEIRVGIKIKEVYPWCATEQARGLGIVMKVYNQAFVIRFTGCKRTIGIQRNGAHRFSSYDPIDALLEEVL